jgi:NTE family protein
VISAVSGGSFTALAYGLWGDAVFDGRFEQRFLRHDIKWELATSMLHPRNFFRLGSVALDRIDVAGTYYDEQIFERAKYGRLLERNRRPFIVINATNLALGQRFEFTQDDFDLLGSDLASVPLGWAAAASSAFPILFSPLRMKYFPGPCCSGALARALTSESAERNDRRRYHWAKSLVRTSGPGAGSYALNEDEHRFLYLMDGGLADNLGLSYVIDNFRHGVIRDRINAGRIEKLVVIVVDAGVRPPEDIEQRESSPGIWTVGYKTAATGIDNFSGALSDMLRLLLLDTPAEHRALCERFQNELNACCSQPAMLDAGHDFTSYVIEVSLQNIPDEAARQRFAQIPTSFALPNADVDALIRMGRALLGDGAQFKQLCADLNVHPR